MADETPGQTQPVKIAGDARLNMVITGVIALAALAFSGYLFTIHQQAVGGTIAGMVVAHYFTTANGQAVGSQLQSTMAAVGQLVRSGS